MALVLSCSEENDLFQSLGPEPEVVRVNTVPEALDRATEGDGVLLLADDYPGRGPALEASDLARVREKGVRMYVEFPSRLPEVALGGAQPARWERMVVASPFLGPELEAGTILCLHGCWFLEARCDAAHLVLARVAGYDRAVYGLPDEAYPVLFEAGCEGIMVATTKLSHFVTGRYAPQDSWRKLWTRLLGWVERRDSPRVLEWAPTVALAAGKDDAHRPGAEIEAFRRSVVWFSKEAVYGIDEKRGAVEGFESGIDHRGRQVRRAWIRADCTAETGMVFAWDWALSGNPASRHLAGQIFDTLWTSPDFVQSDPESPVYGLVNWFDRGPVFYGDDNARVLLASLAGSRLLGECRWDKPILRCLLANLRTTGVDGFRRNSIRAAALEDETDWQSFYGERFVRLSPHYQAYLWACFLWAHASTGYEGFLDRALRGIRATMAAYPRWRWTNGMTQELSRMLLPLAYLVRVQDTPEHRAWLTRVCSDLLIQMEPCGAIREHIGPLDDGTYPPPRSNDAYGTTEASLIQENGDPVCDLLYSTNFAFLGLHEAAAVAEDPRIGDAADRLAHFLCRVQVRSEAQPYLDGAWMRAFDFARWEYWGSSSDSGWGAWCVESGWTNAWISSVLAMRHRTQTLYDVSMDDRFRTHLPCLVAEMGLPEEPGAARAPSAE